MATLEAAPLPTGRVVPTEEAPRRPPPLSSLLPEEPARWPMAPPLPFDLVEGHIQVTQAMSSPVGGLSVLERARNQLVFGCFGLFSMRFEAVRPPPQPSLASRAIRQSSKDAQASLLHEEDQASRAFLDRGDPSRSIHNLYRPLYHVIPPCSALLSLLTFINGQSMPKS